MKNSNISLLQVGKLVVKYFPEVNSVRSGNKSYKALDAFLSALSVEREFLGDVAQKIHIDEFSAEDRALQSDCVSGLHNTKNVHDC